MKIQAIRDGVVYATDGRGVYRETGASVRARAALADDRRASQRPDQRDEPSSVRIGDDPSAEGDGIDPSSGRIGDDSGFERIGTLPLTRDGLAGLRQRLLTDTPWKRALEAVVGSHQTANLWAFPDSMVATAGRAVLVSQDGGRTWGQRLTLPPSSIRMGVLPSGVCRHAGEDAIYLAEYPLAEDAAPRVHRSRDGGTRWETVLALPDVRHVHSVSVDPYEGDLWLTTGDRDEECRLLRVRDGEPEVVGGGSQDWRIVEPAFTRAAVVWGVDCAYADENRIFRLPRSEVEAPSPTPERVGTVDSSVYYAEVLAVGGTEWVALSTAAERGSDRTAPDAERSRDPTAEVVVASADTGFTDWTTLCRYRRRSPLADRTGDPPLLPSASAYVLLASCPERGLFVNPYNTATDDRRIRLIPPSAFPDDRAQRRADPS